jgi:hypothetical protein
VARVKNELLGLVKHAQQYKTMESLRGALVNTMIRYQLQSHVDLVVRLYKKPVLPFVEGAVPLLDWYGGDIRIRLNPWLRHYELHSGKSHSGDHTLDVTDFKNLAELLDLMLSASFDEADSEAQAARTLEAFDIYVQQLGMAYNAAA